VEHQDKRYGPYSPVGGPIPLDRYRSFKKTKTQKRTERIEQLAQQLALPPAAESGVPWPSLPPKEAVLSSQTFVDPDPFQEITFPSPLAAKRAIADELGQPLAKLSAEQLQQIDDLLAQTLDKQQVLAQVRAAFKSTPGRFHAQ
jgi:hypothetical protein